MSRGTWHAIGDGDEPPAGLHSRSRRRDDRDRRLRVHPYTVPHDAREPLQLRCSDGAADLRRADRRRLDHAAHAQRSSGAATRCCSSAITTPRCSRIGLSASLKARIGGPPRPPGERGDRSACCACAARAAAARRRGAPERAEQPARRSRGAALGAALGGASRRRRHRRPIRARLWLAADAVRTPKKAARRRLLDLGQRRDRPTSARRRGAGRAKQQRRRQRSWRRALARQQRESVSAAGQRRQPAQQRAAAAAGALPFPQATRAAAAIRDASRAISSLLGPRLSDRDAVSIS